MDVSIIIINYNSTNLLINAIHSVQKNTFGIDYEIIVVDNASPDKGISLLRKEFPIGINFIESPINRGFGGANNIAIQQAKGKYLFFLNPDTLLVNNAIKILFDFFEHTSSKVGAVGGMLIDEQHQPNNSFGYFPTPSNVISVYTRRNHSRVQKIDHPTCVDFISGADLMVPRQIIDIVGGFDERFFMYCEEADLQKRIEQAGYDRMVIPDAIIIHFEGGSYIQKRSARRRLEQDRSYCYFIKKHYPPITYLLFRIVFFVIRIPAILNPNYHISDSFSYLKMLIKL